MGRRRHGGSRRKPAATATDQPALPDSSSLNDGSGVPLPLRSSGRPSWLVAQDQKLVVVNHRAPHSTLSASCPTMPGAASEKSLGLRRRGADGGWVRWRCAGEDGWGGRRPNSARIASCPRPRGSLAPTGNMLRLLWHLAAHEGVEHGDGEGGLPCRWLQIIPLSISCCRTVATAAGPTPRAAAIFPVFCEPGPSPAKALRYFCCEAVSP